MVVSSGRGGCTLLGELLRRCPSLLALPAESNPYVVIAQLDATDPAAVVAAELARAVGGLASAPLDEAQIAAFSCEWAWRLCAQWPGAATDPEEVEGWVREALPGPTEAIAARVLARARARDARVDARRYDRPGHAPGAVPVAGPPGELLVEMPPFVLPRPWRLATDAELGERPLVLATPRNAYRIAFLAGLFPAASVRVLHLVRNPAASINGLIDGWHHHGFFNCRVPRTLKIGGYSDRADQPWARSWWKYDVPPEWESVVDAPLAEVCALQWRSTHHAALGAVSEHGLERYVVRYEELAGTASEREVAARGLARWLGVPEDELVPVVVRGVAPVMATAPPRPRRWQARAAELAAAVGDERTLRLAEELGYARDPATWR